MKTRFARLTDLYLNKPECVIRLPEWLLPPDKIERYRSLSNLAVVEIAGRDSVAAAVKIVEERGYTDLIPTYAYTATEYGKWESVGNAVTRLSRRLPETRVHDLVVLGSPGFWRALSGRFVQQLISAYGFYTPCIGCHLYLHTVRIPFSLVLGGVPVIAGERERHDGRIKVNQIAEVLDGYEQISDAFGVSLLFPLRHMEAGRQITELLGFEWSEGKEQLGCVFSGNYLCEEGAVKVSAGQIRAFLEGFAKPCAEAIVSSYIQGYIPDHIDIGRRILEHSKNGNHRPAYGIEKG